MTESTGRRGRFIRPHSAQAINRGMRHNVATGDLEGSLGIIEDPWSDDEGFR